MTTVADLAKKVNTTKTSFKTKAKKKAAPAPSNLLTSPSGPGGPGGTAPAAQASGLLKQANPFSAPAPPFTPPTTPSTPAPAPSPTTNFDQIAASIFAPQLADLNKQSGTLKANAAAETAELGSLYANLVKSINGDSQYYNQDYAGANSDLAKTNAQTHGAINSTYDSSAAKEAALLQRLGIQQAAPDVFQQGATDRNFFNDLVDSNNSAYKNQFTAEHKADLTWNKQQGAISQLDGANAQAGVQKTLQEQLAALATQRANLLSQQRSESQSLQSSRASSDLDLAKLQIQQQLADAKTAAAGATKPGKGLQSLLANEATAVGYNSAQAPNAIKAINDSVEYAQPGQADTLQHFLAYVHSRNKNANDWGQLQDLAEYLWQQTNGHIQ